MIIKRNIGPAYNTRSWSATILNKVINLLMDPQKYNSASNLYKLLNQYVKQLKKHTKIPKKRKTTPLKTQKRIEKISFMSPTKGPTYPWEKANSPKQERSANANMETSRTRNWNRPISTDCF